MTTKTTFPADFSDLLAAFESEGVEYLVVGGYAVGVHGRPRATKDLDLWIEGGENLERVARALEIFGLPASMRDQVRVLRDDEVLYFGTPPMRVDLLRSISGVDFADARRRAVIVTLGRHDVRVIGLDDLIVNKRESGRQQDLVDATMLERIRSRGRS